jgi:hypothetical protein
LGECNVRARYSRTALKVDDYCPQRSVSQNYGRRSTLTPIGARSPGPINEGQVTELEFGRLIAAMRVVRLIEMEGYVHASKLNVLRSEVRDVASAASAAGRRSTIVGPAPCLQVYLSEVIREALWGLAVGERTPFAMLGWILEAIRTTLMFSIVMFATISDCGGEVRSDCAS